MAAKQSVKQKINSYQFDVALTFFSTFKISKNNKKEKAMMLLTEVSVSSPSKDNLVEDWEQILEAQDLLIKLK